MSPDIHAPQRIDLATKEQIEAWKEQHGNLACVTTHEFKGTDVVDTHYYLRAPKRYDLSLANREQYDKGGLAHIFDETLIRLCCLCGKAQEIIDDEDKFQSVRTVMIELVGAVPVTVKKL